MTVPANRKQDWGEMGQAMKALPNDRWRAFVNFYLLETAKNGAKNNYGAQAMAARKAGFGRPGTKNRSMAHVAWEIMRDDRMIAAISEESRKFLRAGAPEAVKAVLAGVRDPNHPSHAKFVSMLLDRSDPVESKQLVEVTHRRIDPDTEALEE